MKNITFTSINYDLLNFRTELVGGDQKFCQVPQKAPKPQFGQPCFTPSCVGCWQEVISTSLFSAVKVLLLLWRTFRRKARKAGLKRGKSNWCNLAVCAALGTGTDYVQSRWPAHTSLIRPRCVSVCLPSLTCPSCAHTALGSGWRPHIGSGRGCWRTSACRCTDARLFRIRLYLQHKKQLVRFGCAERGVFYFFFCLFQKLTLAHPGAHQLVSLRAHTRELPGFVDAAELAVVAGGPALIDVWQGGSGD